MFNITGELASEYMSEYEDTDITIVNHEYNDDLEIGQFVLSSGDIWFCDNNDHYRLSRKINVQYIKYDEHRGWIYKNGRSIPWMD